LQDSERVGTNRRICNILITVDLYRFLTTLSHLYPSKRNSWSPNERLGYPESAHD
jgi:hypothetical protein